MANKFYHKLTEEKLPPAKSKDPDSTSTAWERLITCVPVDFNDNLLALPLLKGINLNAIRLSANHYSVG